jgi:hypothetical protein
VFEIPWPLGRDGVDPPRDPVNDEVPELQQVDLLVAIEFDVVELDTGFVVTQFPTVKQERQFVAFVLAGWPVDGEEPERRSIWA